MEKNPKVIKLTPLDGGTGDEFGGSVSIDGHYAIVGASSDYCNGHDSGSAYIFERQEMSWSQHQKLTASDCRADDGFGGSVSINGNYAIVGAPYGDDNGWNSGSAYIFKRSGSSWAQQQKLTASDGASHNYFGNSVSISGDYAIVGAPGRGVDRGCAYMFNRSGSSWIQQAKLTVSDLAAYPKFGDSVSLDGDYAIVGAPEYPDLLSDSDLPLIAGGGAAYIFKRSGTRWNRRDKLLARDRAVYDLFGGSVSISGDYAVVGAEGDDDNGPNSGSAYIFDGRFSLLGDESWRQRDKLKPSDGTQDGNFGCSVSIRGNHAIVGAPGWGVGRGCVYMFKRSGSSWTPQAELTAPDGASDDFFGISVSIGRDYAIVGATGDNDNGRNSGSAYVFRLSQIAD